MYEGMVGTMGFILWSRNDEMRSVGPLQPLTIGLIPWGFLWSFLHTLCSYLVRWMQVGMCVFVYVACFFHAVHYLSYGFCYGGCRIRV